MFQYVLIVILHLFLFIVISLKLQPPVTLHNLRIVIVHKIESLWARRCKFISIWAEV